MDVSKLRYIAFILLLTACSGKVSDVGDGATNFTDCVLPSDQGPGSLLGSWAGIPIPVVYDKDFYMTDGGQAMPALRSAANTWNAWASGRGRVGFTIEDDGTGADAGREIPALVNECFQAAYSAAVQDVVGIWKIGSNGNHKNSRPACDGDRLLALGVQGQTDWTIVNGKITGASVLLNFDEYNAPGKQLLDVESLLLHELGHVLGLLHSCNGSTDGSSDQTTAPACGFAPEKYRSAVMFPFLDVSQIRRDLRRNDLNRVNCLY